MKVHGKSKKPRRQQKMAASKRTKGPCTGRKTRKHSQKSARAKTTGRSKEQEQIRAEEQGAKPRCKSKRASKMTFGQAATARSSKRACEGSLFEA